MGDYSRGPPVSPRLSPVLRQPSDMAAPCHPPAPSGRGRTPPPLSPCLPRGATPPIQPPPPCPLSPPILFFTDSVSTPPLSPRPPVHSGSPELPRAHRIWPQRHHRLVLPVSSACAAIISHWSPASPSPSPPLATGPLVPHRRPLELPRRLRMLPPTVATALLAIDPPLR
jgi:hypothetical protein